MGGNWYVLLITLTNKSLIWYTVASLCKKYQKAQATVGVMDSAVAELTGSINNSLWISEWEKLEKSARVKRGEKLMIYNVASTPGKCFVLNQHFLILTLNSSITGKKTTGGY